MSPASLLTDCLNFVFQTDIFKQSVQELEATFTSATKTHEYVTMFLERFSVECRKVIGFAFTTLRDWLKRFAPLFHPIRSKTKTNCDALACIFPRFASATCYYFEF